MVIWKAAGGEQTEWLFRCTQHALDIWFDNRSDRISVSIEGPAANEIKHRRKRVTKYA